MLGGLGLVAEVKSVVIPVMATPAPIAGLLELRLKLILSNVVSSEREAGSFTSLGSTHNSPVKPVDGHPLFRSL